MNLFCGEREYFLLNITLATRNALLLVRPVFTSILLAFSPPKFLFFAFFEKSKE